jgi:beta-N-acetylhexosaminidase
MLDIDGCELTAEDREILSHPLTGGVILFSRNYYDPQQLQALTHAMRQAANKPLLIATDHEGGRVQRCREGFFALPAMGQLQQLPEPLARAYEAGVIAAYECRHSGIDLALSPVLDCNGISDVIGDRAFASQPADIVPLATHFMQGQDAMGMASTGKHFPGHGSVQADSHVAQAVDRRDLDSILAHDGQVFSALIKTGLLASIMPAHVIYPQVDSEPAGFSAIWLQRILRQRMGFDGVIFSDDLGMHAASLAGSMVERVQAALHAGCDMALVCNDRDAAISVLDGLGYSQQAQQRYSNKPQTLINTRVLSDPQRHQYEQARTSLAIHLRQAFVEAD